MNSVISRKEMLDELVRIANSFQTIGGTELTNYRPFNSFMLEEKINMIIDAITGLIMLEMIKSTPPNTEECQHEWHTPNFGDDVDNEQFISCNKCQILKIEANAK